jgi:transposase-like protein
MLCPSCGSEKTIKNGTIHNGKQKYECKECSRQFVENPQNKIISQDTKDLIEKLLLEKVPLAGIARVTGVSECWLQTYVNKRYSAIEQEVKIERKKKGH